MVRFLTALSVRTNQDVILLEWRTRLVISVCGFGQKEDRAISAPYRHGEPSRTKVGQSNPIRHWPCETRRAFLRIRPIK